MSGYGNVVSYRVGDICRIHGGKPAPKDHDAFDPKGIPFIRMKDLGRYHQTANLTYTDDSLSSSWASENGYKALPAGCIIMPRSGSVALNHRAILGIDSIIVSHICALEVIDPTKVHIPYLYRLLCSIDFRKITKKTTGLDAITFSDLSDIEVDLPDIAKQKYIADILDMADAIRSKRQQAIQLADEFLRSVFLGMFGAPSSNPKNWKTIPIKSFGKVVTGNTPFRKQPEYYGDHIEWIKSDNINTPTHFLTPASEYLSESGRAVARTAPAGSILVTCIAGSRDCIGNVALADREVAFNQQINAIIPNDNKKKWFLYGQILFAKTLIQSASTNSMKGMISKSRFEQIELLNPPERLQRRFGDIFQKHSELTDNLRTLHGKSQETFSSISQRAFRGAS